MRGETPRHTWGFPRLPRDLPQRCFPDCFVSAPRHPRGSRVLRGWMTTGIRADGQEVTHEDTAVRSSWLCSSRAGTRALLPRRRRYRTMTSPQSRVSFKHTPTRNVPATVRRSVPYTPRTPSSSRACSPCGRAGPQSRPASGTRTQDCNCRFRRSMAWGVWPTPEARTETQPR